MSPVEAYAKGCGDLQAGVDERLNAFVDAGGEDLQKLNDETLALYEELDPPPVLAKFHAVMVSPDQWQFHDDPFSDEAMEQVALSLKQEAEAFQSLPDDIQATLVSYGCTVGELTEVAVGSSE